MNVEKTMRQEPAIVHCARCGNTHPSKFKTIKKGTYCTACIEFGRHFIGDILEVKQWMNSSTLFADYEIPYSLTKLQMDCAASLIEFIKNNNDVLVYACCGAGKTEIVFPLITHCLKSQLKIGVAIPRRDVVIELEQRFHSAFPKKLVCSVYGGHQEVLDADIVICTTHQLYRYHQTFDVLILDEVDAFPYKGDRKLEAIAKLACRGNFVYLSATPDRVMKRLVAEGSIKQLTLFRRPHGYPLCIPKVKVGFQWINYIRLVRFLIKYSDKTILLFMPSISSAKQMATLLSLHTARSICLFTSKTEEREQLMKRIRNKEFDVVVCTTVLERGVTIADVQVVVWQADHRIFDEATLIQILGRVGRTSVAYKGEGLLLCQRKSSSVESCLRSLKMMNAV